MHEMEAITSWRIKQAAIRGMSMDCKQGMESMIQTHFSHSSAEAMCGGAEPGNIE